MKYISKTKPRAHQRDTLHDSWDAAAFALFHEQGTGKTKIAIDTAGMLYAAGKIDTLLIVAPNGVQRQWILEQIPKHLGKEVSTRLWWYRSTGGSKVKQSQAAMLQPCIGKLRILSLNYEAMLSKKCLDYVIAFLKSGRCLFVLDESHRIKNIDAQVTKRLLNNSDLADYRRIMTGTPAPEAPLELFSQMRFLDSAILKQTSFAAFRARYAVLEPPGADVMYAIRRRLEQKHRFNNPDPQKLRAMVDRMMPKMVARDDAGCKMYQNLDELKSLIAPFSSRVLKADCLDLPPKQYNKLFVELSTEQRRIYDELKHEYMAEYQGELMTAAMTLTRLTRLQQVTGGFFTKEDGDVLAIVGGNPKLDALLDFCEDTPGKIIIWARFTAELQRIGEALTAKHGADSVARYWGAVGGGSRDENKRRFIEDPACRFFISQPKSGGTGTDGLQVANNAVYFSNERGLIDRLQSEDRGHRIGLEGSMTITDIEAIDTLDRVIIDSLRAKKELADVVMGDPPSNWI